MFENYLTFEKDESGKYQSNQLETLILIGCVWWCELRNKKE
jgi:hypothetical protein